MVVFFGHGAGLSSSSDESGMGRCFFGGAEGLVFLGHGTGFCSLSDKSGMGRVFFLGGGDYQMLQDI